MVKLKFRDFLNGKVIVDDAKFKAWAKDKSIEEIVHEFMDLPSNVQVKVWIGKKGARISCFICRGGVTERNGLYPSFTMKVENENDMCINIAVCSERCEGRLAEKKWLEPIK